MSRKDSRMELRLPADLKARLDAACERTQWSSSALVRYLVERWLKETNNA